MKGSFEQAVEVDEPFSHHCRERHLDGFAAGAQLLVVGSDTNAVAMVDVDASCVTP